MSHLKNLLFGASTPMEINGFFVLMAMSFSTPVMFVNYLITCGDIIYIRDEDINESSGLSAGEWIRFVDNLPFEDKQRNDFESGGWLRVIM